MAAPAFGGDLVAGAGALALAWAAVAASRRARGGDADSVWVQPVTIKTLSIDATALPAEIERISDAKTHKRLGSIKDPLHW